MPGYDNIFQAPFTELVKTAEEGGSFSKLAHDLVSGDPNSFSAHLTEEDQAFFSLSDNTRVKLASGIRLSANDVNRMPETEVAALTLLGNDAMFKVAAYSQFYNETALAEAQGRNLARTVIGQHKEAQEKRASEILRAQGEKLAQNKAFRTTLSKRASAELRRRRRG